MIPTRTRIGSQHRLLNRWIRQLLEKASVMPRSPLPASPPVELPGVIAVDAEDVAVDLLEAMRVNLSD